MIRLTRRELVRMLAPVLATVPARAAAGPARPPGREIALTKEFPQSSSQAHSPDGRMLCLEDWAARGYPLRVVELGTWKEVYAGQFPSRTQAVGFFSDGESLLVRALTSSGKGTCGVGKGNCSIQESVVHLGTGVRTERVFPIDPDRGETFWPLSPGVLLNAHRETRPWTTETLALVEYPSLREVAKVPYATEPREPQASPGQF